MTENFYKVDHAIDPVQTLLWHENWRAKCLR